MFHMGVPELMIVALIGSFFFIPLLINIVVCAFLYSALRRVPAEFRRQDPALVWLLLIPVFHLVWNFFVYPRVSQSYQAYFAAAGRRDGGDGGEGIGLAYCICAACSLIPGIGCVVLVATFVLLVLYLVRLRELSAMVPAGTQPQIPPVAPAP